MGDASDYRPGWNGKAMMMGGQAGFDSGCVWTRDYLRARQFRRAYIAKHRQVAA